MSVRRTYIELIKAHPALDEMIDDRNLEQGCWVFLKKNWYNGMDSNATPEDVAAMSDEERNDNMSVIIHRDSWRECWSDLKHAKEWG